MRRHLNRIHLRTAFIAASALIILTTSRPLRGDEPDRVLVSATTGLSLRTEMNTSAERIEMLEPFQPLRVLSREGEWARVKKESGGESGWVLASYLSRTLFVSVAADTANARVGPGEQYDRVLEFSRNYPLRVLSVADGWLKVEDYDGDQGWIAAGLVSHDTYVITKLRECNVRSGVGTENDIVFKAERGVILKVLEEKDGWLKVRHNDGDEGWMSAKIVFGWLPSD